MTATARARGIRNAGRLLILALVTMAAATGCAKSEDHGGMPGEMSIVAENSLRQAMAPLVNRFELDNPGLKVHITYTSSRDLVQKLASSPGIDVLMTSDTPTMEEAHAKGLVGAAEVFATSPLTLAVPRNNLARVSGLDGSLTKARLAICQQGTACRRITDEAAAKNSFALNGASEEGDSSDVVARVASGRADAGLVYFADVSTAKDALVPVPLKASARTVCKAAPTTKANEMAQYWMKLMASQMAAGMLRDAGWGPRT